MTDLKSIKLVHCYKVNKCHYWILWEHYICCSGEERVVIGSHSHEFATIDSGTAELIVGCKLMDRIESSACVSPCGKFGFVG